MATPRAQDWEHYLDPEETILWQGRPAPGWSWRGGENGTILLGLFVLGFIWFFTLEQVWYGEPLQWGFVLVWTVFACLLALLGPVAMAMVRRGTWYTLTSRRAIIAHCPTVAGITVYRGLDCYPVTSVDCVPSDLRGLETVHFSRLSQRHTFHEKVAPGKVEQRSRYGQPAYARSSSRVRTDHRWRETRRAVQAGMPQGVPENLAEPRR